MSDSKELNEREKAEARRAERGRKMFYTVVVCNGLAILLSVCALAISIASVASDDWFHYIDTNMTGLFMGCDYNGNNCFNLDEIGPIKSWLYAVRAFFILMILFGSVGCTFYAASFFLVEKTHLALISTGLIVAAGIFGFVACAIYAMSTDDVIPNYFYGTGFILGWISCSFFFIGGTLLGASGGNGSDDYNPQTSIV